MLYVGRPETYRKREVEMNKKWHKQEGSRTVEAPDTWTSHTTTHRWCQVEPASHTCMLVVYGPCFFLFSFVFPLNFLSNVL